MSMVYYYFDIIMCVYDFIFIRLLDLEMIIKLEGI